MTGRITTICREPDGCGVVPTMNDPVRVTLAGHVHTYVVRVGNGHAGPYARELRIINGDPAEPIGYEALRNVPVTRIVRAATQYLDEIVPTDKTGPVNPPRGTPRALTDQFLAQVAREIKRAIGLGHPVRPTVAKRFDVPVRTLDRWIRKVKERGLLEQWEIPQGASARLPDPMAEPLKAQPIRRTTK